MDRLIINFTHFRKLPYLRRFYNYSYRKATSSIWEKGEKYASIEQIIKWTVKKSKLLDENVVYLLQYSHYLTDEVLDERKLLIEILNQSNIRFIDTFDYLHGDLKPTSLRPIPDIWFSHHTPLGNKIVCKAILESGIYNE